MARTGGRTPPLCLYTGYTALCPFRDRERPVGQRSSVPKIDKLEGLTERIRIGTTGRNYQMHKKCVSKQVHTAAKLMAWKSKPQTGHPSLHMATDKVKVQHMIKVRSSLLMRVLKRIHLTGNPSLFLHMADNAYGLHTYSVENTTPHNLELNPWLLSLVRPTCRI